MSVPQSVQNKVQKWLKSLPKANLGVRQRKMYKKKQSFAAKVKKIIAGKEETKQKTQTIYDSIATGINFNSGINTSGECYNVLPDVGRGDTSYERDGDKIQPMYCNLRFNMSLNGGQPAHVYLFVLEDKLQRDGNTTRDYNFLNLNGQDTNFDGTWVNSCLPVNTEDFKLIARRRIRLAYDQQPAGAGTAATESSPMFKEVNIKVPIKRYKYFDYYGAPSTSNQPKNHNLFWAIGYLNSDGTSDSGLTARLRVTCLSTFYYKDA